MASEEREIKRLMIRGTVQGIGFRVWVEREALALGLKGWVRNRRDGISRLPPPAGEFLPAGDGVGSEYGRGGHSRVLLQSGEPAITPITNYAITVTVHLIALHGPISVTQFR